MGIISGIVCSIIVLYFLVASTVFEYKGAAIAILLLEAVASVRNMLIMEP